MKKLIFGLFAITYIILSYPVYSQMVHPYNLDFEKGAPNTIPVGWTIPASSIKEGLKVVTTDEFYFKGKYCMGVFPPQNIAEDEAITVMQSLNAGIYLGKKVKLRAAVKFEKLTPNACAFLWLKVNIEEEQSGLYITTAKDEISKNEWQYFEIEGTVDDFAQIINFGIITTGWCKAWIDDVSLVILDTVDISKLKSPAKLTDDSKGFLSVFAKLYGYLRFFYPSFESLQLDWNKYAYAGVEYFENLKSPKELEKALSEFFIPVAPGIEVYKSSSKPIKKLITSFPEKSLKNVILVNKYEGSRDLMKLARIPYNIFESTRETEGSVYQLLNAASYVGKKMIFSAMAKVESEFPFGQAQLIIQMEKKYQKHAKREFLPDFTITGNQWKKYSVEMEIPGDYDFIVLQLAIVGEGKAYFDNIEFKEAENPENLCKNPGFELEKNENLVYGWTANPISLKENYRFRIVQTKPAEGSQCLLIESDSASIIKTPGVGDIFTANLGQNISFRMPLVLYVDSVQTLPYSEKGSSEKFTAGFPGIQFHVMDRTSRLANVVIAWNMVKHFGQVKKDERIWDKALNYCLEKAAVDSTENDFLETLNYLATLLDDPQARFWNAAKEYTHALPFLLKWINDRLYISEVAVDKNLRLKPGYEILEINGRPIANYFKDKSSYLTGNDTWKKLRLAAIVRTGFEGDKVKLKYRQTNNRTEESEFSKDIYINDLTENKPERVAFFDPTSKLGDSLPGGIYYIDLTRVSEEEIELGSAELALADGIIFDLRGYANVSYNILGYMTKDTIQTFDWLLPVFTGPGHDYLSYRRQFRRIAPKKIQLGKKIVFLCDEKTIGNSEFILYLAQKYNMGKIVGTTTGGSPGVSTAVLLPFDFSFSMTELKLRDKDTKQLIATPIVPDVMVTHTLDGIIEIKDESLAKAIEILSK